MEENKQELPVTPIKETPAEKTSKEVMLDETNSPTIAEFLGEPEVKLEEEVIDKEVIPEEEKKPLETTPIVPEPEKAPEIPLEEISDKIRADERKKVTEDILEAVGVSKEEKKLAEDTGFKFAWEERGENRPASWREQSEETVKLYKYNQELESTKINEERTKVTGEVAKRETEINEEWDSQIDWLVESGEIPAVNPEIVKKLKEGKPLIKAEMADAGLQIQRDIFNKMYEIDQLTGGKGTKDVVHVYNRYIKTAESKKPAGAKAPVSGGRTPLSTPSEEIDYNEIHNSNFEDIITS